ncbi:amino acid permease [Paeniglutamicibacter cryotolerans]|uniref:Histidine transporter n=1 Tax=Paeniglutamicibacter cryotolerans TaxID=670079 RepID=A0A839QKI3_9MICC|nr:amino acid permease [Paeniglutamicibacter cryotolerans]MBB2995075.1 histidine transporter [Paeniglutamicibacter cryotolerans]
MTTVLTQTTPPESDSKRTLQRGLTPRHVRFIALGSAIGTGLFYGSAKTIQTAGPAVLIAYVIAGLLVFAVMRSLGEMAVRHPIAGSFAQYAGRYISPRMGFLTGWTFVFEMIVVAIADMTAVGTYMRMWFPDTPGWIWMLAALLLIAGLNTMRVGIFGEMEFWFSLIKVTTIIALIGTGLYLIVFGISTGGYEPGVHNLVDFGGFAPFGVWGIIMSLGIVVFSFGGIETLGMTAGEADDPATSIPQAVNTVPVRVLLFYVLSLGVLMCLIPWHTMDPDISPFVQVFAGIGIPGAVHVINAVVLTAALSAMNSIVYAAVRAMFGLAAQGHAPKSFAKVNRHGIPTVPVALVSVCLLVGLGLYFWIPDQLFLVVASIATFATLFVWTSILLSHHLMRRELARENAPKGIFALPLWPLPTYLGFAFMALVVVILGFSTAGRTALIVGGVWIVLLLAAYQFLVPASGRIRPALENYTPAAETAAADATS